MFEFTDEISNEENSKYYFKTLLRHVHAQWMVESLWWFTSLTFFAMKCFFVVFLISFEHDDPGAARWSFACSVFHMSPASLADIQESLCIYLCPVIRLSCLLGGCGDLQGHLSWHGLPICSSRSVAVTALFIPCSGWLCCSPTICQHFAERWLFFSFLFSFFSFV